MHNSVWTTLLRQIPPEKQAILTVVTAGGVEIAVQCVLRIDAEFLALKGRLAGTQDAGRIFFIPFNRIEYLSTQQELKESEFQEMFPAAPAETEAEAPLPEEPAEAAMEDAPPTGLPSKTPLPPSVKSAVLDRFRSRGSSLRGTSRSASGTGPRPAGLSSLGTVPRPSANG
jgi:hypothetical protein